MMKTPAISAVLCILLLLTLCFAVPDGQVLWEAADALYTGNELSALSFQAFPFGTGLAASALLAFVCSFLLSRQRVSLYKALVWFACAMALGILLARLLYCVVDPAYYNPKWFSRLAVLRLWDGGMAMTGAIAGILLAGKLIPDGLRLIPVAAPIFIAGARFSEAFTQLGYGPSVYFEGLLTRQVGYAVRLNVSLLEGTMALVILICILLLLHWASRHQVALGNKQGICAFLILYGITQIFMESLRKDRHMIWGFTKAQQILAILLVFGALLCLASGKKEKGRVWLVTLCCVVPLIGLEFALDRADVPILVLYGAYLLILAAYLWASYRIYRRSLATLLGTSAPQ